MNKENKTNKSNILTDDHGEPTGFMYIVMVITLLSFGLIWSVAKKVGLKLYWIYSNMITEYTTTIGAWFAPIEDRIIQKLSKNLNYIRNSYED